MGEPKVDLNQRKTEDALRETSDTPGLRGAIEGLMRRFRQAFFGAVLTPLAFLCAFCIGVSLMPSIYLFRYVLEISANWAGPLQALAIGCALSIGFLLYGFTLIFVVPAVNFFMPKPKPFRAIWFSLPSIPWYIHNALTYIVRYTFLEFLTPTPFNILFYRMMGMKVGKGVVINTTNISDPCLVTLEDYVTIGGSAHLFAHYGQKGFLIVQPIHIGRGSTIGLKSSIMGDVIVGQNCVIRPHTCLLPKSRVADNETV